MIPDTQHASNSLEALEIDSATTYSLPLENFFQPLASFPSASDLELSTYNQNPTRLTARLHEMVPLLQFVNFQLECVTEHETIATIPLLPSTMNQNGTHQASIFYLLSDYLAGIALYAGLPGSYTVGVHDRGSGQPIQFWLKTNTVHHLKPGTGLIRGKVCLPEDTILVMRDRLTQKGRCDVSVHVEIFQDGELVATANPEMGIYKANPRSPHERASFFHREDSKLSAKLIAGLRPDSLSQSVAGAQGRALAQRFAAIAPQLPELVIARGRHLANHLDQHRQIYGQVVVLGLGLDVQPLRYASSSQYWFGIDLRQSLVMREQSFVQAGGDSEHLKYIPTDLRTTDWGRTLLTHSFDPTVATFFIAEGLVPYLHKSEILKLLRSISQLCLHNSSRVWIDHFSPLFYTLNNLEIQAFLQNISRLGEPFITGFNKVEDLNMDWKTVSQHLAEEWIGEGVSPHPVYQTYYFSVLALISQKLASNEKSY